MEGDHVFCVDAKVYMAISDEELKATTAAMREMDLYHLPYDGPIILRFLLGNGSRQYLEARGLREGEEFSFDHVVICPKWEREPDFKLEMGVGTDNYRNLTPTLIRQPKIIEGKNAIYRYRAGGDEGLPYGKQASCRDFLIVLLASRGLEKKTKNPKKLQRLGIGRQDHYAAYVTTIQLRSDLERGSANEAKPGMPVRPHLRRGHIRHQHFGKHNQEIKKIWIDPVFVNVDDDFVNRRTAYRIIH